jgi:hypothetical protein
MSYKGGKNNNMYSALLCMLYYLTPIYEVKLFRNFFFNYIVILTPYILLPK